METEKLNELIEYLTDTIKSTGGFIQEQAPDIISQLIDYKVMLYTNCLWIFGIISAILLFIGILNIIFSEYNKEVGVMLLVISIIPIIVTTSNYIALLKISIAPKVYILDYLKTLI